MPTASPALNSAAPRSDFPLLAQHPELAYLDNAATTQKPDAVIAALREFLEQRNASVHRGIYTLSAEATEAYEDAHRAVARFISASGMEEVIFTKGTTESLNLLSHSLRSRLRAGDEIVLSKLEHHSNLVPWQRAAAATGAKLKFIDLAPDGSIDLASAERAITDRTKIVSVAHVSNVLGSVAPLRELAGLAHQHGSLLIADAAQSVPHQPVEVRKLECDFLAFSGHKLYGPTGIGALWGRRELLEGLDPFLTGGDMIRTVSYESATWNELPWKFEAGTPAAAEAAGLAAAISYLERIGMDTIHRTEKQLTASVYNQLRGLPGVTVYGPEQRGPLCSFALKGVHPHDLATLLNERGIAVRAGHLCAMPLMERLGVPALARASLGIYTARDELDRLIAGIQEAQKVFT